MVLDGTPFCVMTAEKQGTLDWNHDSRDFMSKLKAVALECSSAP